ncbi:hypothetical protein [Hymenobacter koreensis]
MTLSASLRASALLVLLTLGCQRSQPDTENASPQAVTDPATTPAAMAQRLSPLLRGVWVRTDYVEAVQRTRSPLAAAGRLRGVVALSINPARRRGDSLLVEANLNNHEADQLTAYFRPGRTAMSLPTNRVDYERSGGFYELTVSVNGPDTTLLWQRYTKSERPLETLAFQRVRGLTTAPGASGEAVQRVVNAQLLAGAYAATDSTGRRSQVRLLPNGTVQGLPGIRSYRVATDFVVTLANDRDNMVLNAGTKRPQLCTYGFRGDTLRIYAARIVEPELRQGALRYTLVRQH